MDEIPNAFQRFQEVRVRFEPVNRELRELIEKWRPLQKDYQEALQVLQEGLDGVDVSDPLWPERTIRNETETPRQPKRKARPRGAAQAQILHILDQTPSLKGADLLRAVGSGGPKCAKILCGKGFLRQDPKTLQFSITSEGSENLKSPEVQALLERGI